MNYELNEELYFNILNSSKNTSPGFDKIPTKVVKMLDYEIHKYIIKIFEFCIRRELFPNIWKRGEIITIPKPSHCQAIGKNLKTRPRECSW